jgi:molecular chaperone GrpE (heat shock protein)
MVFEKELKERTMEFLDALDQFESADAELHELKDVAFKATYKLLKRLLNKEGINV